MITVKLLPPGLRISGTRHTDGWMLKSFLCIISTLLKGSSILFSVSKVDGVHYLSVFWVLQLRHIAVTCGAAAEGVHPEDQCV